MGKENKFQKDLIKEIEVKFPGSIVVKNDPNFIQGIPDLTVFHNDKYAILECKKSLKETYQPNQEYYIDKFHTMSFAKMICPENKEEVIDELQQLFTP